MFRSKTSDATHLPLFHKTINKLVQQAGHVMKSMDPLLDSFLWFVKSVIQLEYGKTKEMTIPAHGGNTRHCNIAILTMGSVDTKVNGFANEIHVDKKDLLTGDFVKIALRELDNFETRYQNNPMVLKDVKYLRNLYNLCGGFPVATVCGYQMPFLDENENKKRGNSTQVHAHFPMPGIASSVRLRPGMYHYFLGGVFSHCTSIPVAVDITKSNPYSLFSRSGVNVVAWGAGSSSGQTVWRNFVDRNLPADEDVEQRPINNRGLLQWLRDPRNGNRLEARLPTQEKPGRRLIDVAVADRVRGALTVRNELDNAGN